MAITPTYKIIPLQQFLLFQQMYYLTCLILPFFLLLTFQSCKITAPSLLPAAPATPLPWYSIFTNILCNFPGKPHTRAPILIYCSWNITDWKQEWYHDRFTPLIIKSSTSSTFMDCSLFPTISGIRYLNGSPLRKPHYTTYRSGSHCSTKWIVVFFSHVVLSGRIRGKLHSAEHVKLVKH